MTSALDQNPNHLLATERRGAQVPAVPCEAPGLSPLELEAQARTQPPGWEAVSTFAKGRGSSLHSLGCIASLVTPSASLATATAQASPSAHRKAPSRPWDPLTAAEVQRGSVSKSHLFPSISSQDWREICPVLSPVCPLLVLTCLERRSQRSRAEPVCARGWVKLATPVQA